MNQYQHPVPAMETRPTTIRRSMALIALGVILWSLNIFLFIFCFVFSLIDGISVVYILGIVSALYHTIYGILAILGGFNIERYRGCVIANLVMGIGGFILIVSLFAIDIIIWADADAQCNSNCNSEHFKFCSTCSNLTLRFLPILLVSFIVAVIDIVASGITCCNICSCCCCNDPLNSGVVVNQAPYNYGSTSTNQVQTQYPSPYYSVDPQTGANQLTWANPAAGQNNQQINTKSEINDH